MNRIEKLIAELCPNGVEWKKLGEVCESISSGKNKSRNPNGKYPVFGSTGIIAYSNNYVYDKEAILIARVGANAGFVNKSKGKYDVSDNTLILLPKEEYHLMFAYYQLKNFNLNKLTKGGGQSLITASQIKKFPSPSPHFPSRSGLWLYWTNLMR